MACHIWIRLELPEEEFRFLRDTFPDCEFYRGKNGASDEQYLQRIDGVFTEETVSDDLLSKMTNLKWMHVTRGGVNTYLTPSIKYRPIQVTGSKGVHGGVFS